MGSTLTHVRYYLDDPVHLLVSCAELHSVSVIFVHHGSLHMKKMPKEANEMIKMVAKNQYL